MRLAIARKITSCTFIARSTAVAGLSVVLPPFCRFALSLDHLGRTNHVLTQPGISNDSASFVCWLLLPTCYTHATGDLVDVSYFLRADAIGIEVEM